MALGNRSRLPISSRFMVRSFTAGEIGVVVAPSVRLPLIIEAWD